jgi:hypothetical protein
VAAELLSDMLSDMTGVETHLTTDDTPRKGVVMAKKKG